MPLHGKTTENYGWEWYEMLFVVTRGSDSRLTIACFDVPKDLQLAIHSDLLQLARDKRKLMLQDPHAAMAVILHQIIVAYDRSVWAIRDHICEWEAVGYTLIYWYTERWLRNISQLTFAVPRLVRRKLTTHSSMRSRDTPSTLAKHLK